MSKTWRENPEKYRGKKKKKHFDSQRMSKKEFETLVIDRLSRELFNK